ncbi:MAG: Bax inhibitor-1/YccA family protein [Spirochaetaceae bacterium]|nr:Bax inhibitor-1/YccA family protein [Spirochaetaceae bacterium]
MVTGLLASGAQARYRTILRNVYMWMSVGLSLTAVVAWWAANSVTVRNILFENGRAPIFILIIGTFLLVFLLSRNIMTMSVPAAMGGFMLYAVLNGVLMSFIFLAYTGTVIFQAFAVSAGMFAVMSLWAITTKRDLSGWGHYLFMGLIGLIIAGVVGIFIGGETYHFLYSAVGVVLFTALTAYDTQMIKRMSDGASADVGESDFVRLSIIGALKLYLDFINMFLFLLRIFGRRR